jgi:hypothetical protein
MVFVKMPWNCIAAAAPMLRVCPREVLAHYVLFSSKSFSETLEMDEWISNLART